MEREDLTFPVTLEAFVAYQETGIGRSLGSDERAALAAWLPLINISYEDGLHGNTASMGETLDWVAAKIHQNQDDEDDREFLKCMRYWVAYAYSYGCHVAGKEEKA